MEVNETPKSADKILFTKTNPFIALIYLTLNGLWCDSEKEKVEGEKVFPLDEVSVNLRLFLFTPPAEA